jgi:hypothetical protein
MVSYISEFATRYVGFTTKFRGEIGNSLKHHCLLLFVFGMHSHKPTMMLKQGNLDKLQSSDFSIKARFFGDKYRHSSSWYNIGM